MYNIYHEDGEFTIKNSRVSDEDAIGIIKEGEGWKLNTPGVHDELENKLMEAVINIFPLQEGQNYFIAGAGI